MKSIDAVECSDVLSVKTFIEDGFDIHSHSEFALRTACRIGCLELVILLVENGADVNTWNNAPFGLACDYDHENVARYLIERGTLIFSWQMVRASLQGYLSVVEFILEYGNVNTETLVKSLRCACVNRHTSIVKLLVKKGVDIHVADGFENDYCREIVQLLSEYGASFEHNILCTNSLINASNITEGEFWKLVSRNV